MDSRSGRYKMLRLPNHPLASSNGTVSEHRVILYDKIGDGIHPCYFCGIPVHWAKGTRTSKRGDSLYVDHLNKDTHDNRPENLAPSCLICNQRRRYDAIQDGELIIKLSGGHKTRGVARQCHYCGRTFYIAPSSLNRRGRGKYCSRDCMYQRGQGKP